MHGSGAGGDVERGLAEELFYLRPLFFPGTIAAAFQAVVGSIGKTIS